MAKELPANPFWLLIHAWPGMYDRFIFRDIVVNVALYVPAGITGHLAFRKWGKVWLSLAAPVAICTVLSASIEMIQLYVPSRDTSMMDLITNLAGAVIGVAAGIVLEDVLLRRRAAAARKPRRPPDRAALTLIGNWVAWLLFPLIPVMGHYPLAHKLSVLADAPVLALAPFVSSAIAWFAAGNLMQAGALRPSRQLTAISVALIPAQLFIVDRQPVPAEFLGAVAGAASFAILWPLRRTHRRGYRQATAWAFLAVILIRGLAPFHFAPEATAFSWIPFSGFLNMNWQAGVQVIAEKFFWYGTAIWLLRAAGMRLVTATAMVAALLWGIEIAQMHLPGRIAEVTDPLWASFSGFAIAILARNPPSGANS